MYEDLPAFYAGDYARVRAQHYDIVLNGVEIGGGSVRIHDPEMQEYVFQNVLQVSISPPTISFFSFHHPRCISAEYSGPGTRKCFELLCVHRMFSITSGHRANAFRAVLIPAGDALFHLSFLFLRFLRLLALRNLRSRRSLSLD